MNKNKIAFSSLAMDLKRVALSYHNGSLETAKRFLDEAIKRAEDVDKKSIKPYLKKILNNLDSFLDQKDNQKIAEDALMYSTLFQNAALKLK